MGQASVDQAPRRADAGRPAPQDAGAGEAAAPERATGNAVAEKAAAEQAAAVPKAARERPAAGKSVAERAAAEQRAAKEAAAERAAARRVAAQQAAARQGAAQQAADEAAVQRAAKVLARKSSPARTHRLVGLAAALLLVIGGVTAGVAFAGHSGHHDHLASSNSVATIVVNREHAAAWIARQVSPATVVSCDPVTCVLIESHGFPASHVRGLATG